MIPTDPFTLAIVAAAIIGVAIGIIITVIMLVDRPRHWLMWVRVPEEAYRQIVASASAHGWSVKREILHRLRGKR
jgi:hypothetical protein